ncbi:MAG: BatD family protein [Candidatus Omnitrophota bacterium]
MKQFRRAIIFCVFLSLCGSSFAEEVTFEVKVDRTRVSVGEDIQLDFAFYGTQDIATPYFPGVEGMDWQYLGPARMMSIINGVTTVSITHRYRLLTHQAGTYEIPALSVQYRGQTYTSPPITIEVVSGSPGQYNQPPRQQEKAPPVQPEGLENRALVVMEVGKRQAYVNEAIPIKVKLYVSRMAIRDIQYPEFAHEGFSVGEYSVPRQYQEAMNGIAYTVVEFTTEAFGLWGGDLRLGPAVIKCNALVRQHSAAPSWFDDDFFGGNFFNQYDLYPLELKALDVPMAILPLPEENAPSSFNGAIGNYKFDLQANPREVKVGDPITLKISIFGSGNFKTVKPPALDFGNDFKIYDPQVVQENSAKVFEQVIIPTNESVKFVPAVKFSSFNPETQAFEELTRGPIPITVTPLAKSDQLAIFERSEEGKESLQHKEVLGKDIIFIKDSPGVIQRRGQALYKNRIFLMLLVVPLLAVILVAVLQKRRERLETDVRYARRLRAPGKARKNIRQLRHLLGANQPQRFFDAVFKTLQEYLGDKFHLPRGGITADVITQLQARAIAAELLAKLKDCFNRCDMARYAPASITKEEMRGTLALLEEIIDALEKVKG